MDNWFQSKWFIRIISLIFAISLYVFVTVETDTIQDESRIFTGPTKEVQVLDDVPVDIRIDSEKYVVSGVPEHVTVSLEGRTSFLTPIVRQRNFTVYVDLSDKQAGEHTVQLEYDNVPGELSVYIEPETVNVVIEERATEEFTVELDFVNSAHFPVGYELGETVVNPQTVTITSSRAVIDQIAMVKVFVDVAGLTESIKNRVLPINVYDSQGNDLNVRVEPESVGVAVEVDHPSKIVPLKLPTKGKLPDGLELKSLKPIKEEIEVFGTKEILSEITEVSTKEIDLSVIESSGKINVELDLPNTIMSNETEIEIDVEVEQTKVFDDVDVEVKGVGDKAISYVKPSKPVLSVTAVGNEKVVNKMKKEDVIPSIHVSNLTKGRHKLMVKVNGPNDIKFKPEYKEMTIEIK